MSKFEVIDTLFGDVRYMTPDEAEVMREIIEAEDAQNVLEIGFFQGKSSAYIAAILEDRGAGSLTTIDMQSAAKHVPNIETILAKTGLSHRVTPIYCHRSYTWALQRLITAPDRPKFDLCYFDGGHTWDATGFGVLLVDMLLRPGGVLVLDAMNWSMGRSPHYKKNPKLSERFDSDEIEAEPVRLVWDTILPHLGYEHVREYDEFSWGLARKPSAGRQV